MYAVAGIQIAPIMKDVKGNLKRGVKFLEEAVKKEAKLVVFPELWTTGYYLSKESFTSLAELPDGRTVSMMQELALKHDTAIVCPFVEKNDEQLHISAAVISNKGDFLGLVRKSLLWGREKEIFTPGTLEFPTFNSPVGRIGVLICYEMEFPETSRLLALEGAEIIVCPSVWSLSASHRWDIQLPARALDNTVYVLGVNTVTNNSCGKSKLLSPLGDILAEASEKREEILLRTVDVEAIKWAREDVAYIKDFKEKLTPGGRMIPVPCW